MDQHYTEISSKYDYMHEHIHQTNTPIIINKLQLTPDDLLLDIGAATGQQAHMIRKQVGLKNPVTCVEPCQAFFENLSKLDGIVPVMQTAEQFCDQLAQEKEANQPFNKVLLCGVDQHIDKIVKCLGQILDYLPKNGICFIFNLPSAGLCLPLTPLQLKHIEEVTPEILDDIVPYVKSREDVITEVTYEEPAFMIPKCTWYYMIRNYFRSTFRKYTKEELEESIKELDNGIFKGVKDKELITIVDKYIAVKITKI